MVWDLALHMVGPCMVMVLAMVAKLDTMHSMVMMVAVVVVTADMEGDTTHMEDKDLNVTRFSFKDLQLLLLTSSIC